MLAQKLVGLIATAITKLKHETLHLITLNIVDSKICPIYPPTGKGIDQKN